MECWGGQRVQGWPGAVARSCDREYSEQRQREERPGQKDSLGMGSELTASGDLCEIQ